MQDIHSTIYSFWKWQLSTGGGGGNIGKGLSHGGGDGGDDGGDDDDYFDNFDEGEEGDEGGLFRRRMILGEVTNCSITRNCFV